MSRLYKEEVEVTLPHGAALASWYAKSLIAAVLARLLSSEISDVMGDLRGTFSGLLGYPEGFFYAVPISHEVCTAPFSSI